MDAPGLGVGVVRQQQSHVVVGVRGVDAGPGHHRIEAAVGVEQATALPPLVHHRAGHRLGADDQGAFRPAARDEAVGEALLQRCAQAPLAAEARAQLRLVEARRRGDPLDPLALEAGLLDLGADRVLLCRTTQGVANAGDFFDLAE